MTETTISISAVARPTIRRTVWEWDNNYTRSAMDDILLGIGYWPLWVRLGWQDVMLRYRRSMIGPFWLTISMGIMVFALGLFYGKLFAMNVDRYLPFLTVGFLVWNLITSLLSEGCQTFVESEGFIRQIDLPLSMFPLRVIWRNLIIFFHNAVIYVVVVVVFDITLGWSLLLVIPGLFLLLANAIWSTTLLGILSARFRDLPQIVASILQVAFFITPIIWMPEAISNRRLLVEGNPFYHFIELIRAPLLGHPPTLMNWSMVLAITLGGWVGTFLFYRRFHSRIAYWV